MKILLAFILFLTSLPLHAEDMQTYLSKTREMVSEGKHKEALERFIWFHNHALEHEPSMYGVRLSFALSAWRRLGDVYPPALTALREIRDQNTALIKEGKGDFHLFHDVVALNEALNENEKTIQLFERIDKDQPERANRFWTVAKDPVLKEKRYDLARKYIGNPMREFNRIRETYDHNTTLYDDPRIGGEHFKAYNENRLVRESLKLIDLALALNDKEAAAEIRTTASSIVDDHRLREPATDGER